MNNVRKVGPATNKGEGIQAYVDCAKHFTTLTKCLAFHRSLGFTQHCWECGCSRIGASVLTILGTSPGSVSLRDSEMRRRSVYIKKQAPARLYPTLKVR